MNIQWINNGTDSNRSDVLTLSSEQDANKLRPSMTFQSTLVTAIA